MSIMADCPKEIIACARELRIPEATINSLGKFLALIEEKDPKTYVGSCKVGLMAKQAGEVLGLKVDELLFAGSLHDIGKTLIRQEVLNVLTPEEWNRQCKKEMRQHPEFSYRLLRDFNPYVAEISLRHHRHQKDAYPKKLPPLTPGIDKSELPRIEESSLVVSILDCYDAYNRNNGRNKEDVMYSSEARKEQLLKDRPAGKDIIEILYNERILI